MTVLEFVAFILSIVLVSDGSMLDFYPFGLSKGDTEIPHGQLESTNEVVSLKPGVPFRGRAYDRVLISPKGFIKFRTIAGNDLKFWYLTVIQNDVKDFVKGSLFYRQTTDVDLLTSTAREVTKYFPAQSAFNPLWGLVVTWSSVEISNQIDDVTVTTTTLVRNDVNICKDTTTTTNIPIASTDIPNITETVNITETPLPTAPPCVNISDATYVQESATHVYRKRTSTATFQAIVTTDGTYTYFILNYNGVVTCQGTGFESMQDNTVELSTSRDLLLPGPSNIGEHGKWMYEMGTGCSEQLDILFALDTSGSVGNANLNTLKDVVFYILRQLNLGENNIRSGLIGFHEEATVASDLSPSMSVLRSGLFGIQLGTGPSNMVPLLKMTRLMLSHQNGGRPEVSKVVIVFTDGQSTDDPELEAGLAKAENIVFIFVAIGEGINFEELKTVSHERNILTVFDFRGLSLLQDLLIDKICRAEQGGDPKTQVKVEDPTEVFLDTTNGTMLGGNIIHVYGPCFTENETPVASFASVPTNCTVITTNVAQCVVPMVFVTGQVNVQFDIGRMTSIGHYTYENPLWSKPNVIRVNPLDWMNNDDVTVSMNPDLLPGNHVNIELLGYKENARDGTVTLEILSLIAGNVKKAKSLTFRRPSLVGLDEFTTGVIRISASGNTNISLWSDVHSIAWALDVTSSDVCQAWIRSEYSKTGITQESMPQCPCTLSQAKHDIGRFRQESGCMDSSSFPISEFCRIDVSHNVCFTSRGIRSDGYYQRCCYGNGGSLLDAKYFNGGGISARYSSFISGFQKPQLMTVSGTVPVFSHLYHDVIPYYHCCVMSNVSSQCTDYIKLRPASDCRLNGGYKPPAIGVIGSDPIISTLDGNVYSLDAIGEFILLEIQEQDVQIQGRVGRSNVKSDEIVLNGVAMWNRIGQDSQILQIGLNPESANQKLLLRADGRLDYVERLGHFDYGGFSITRASYNEIQIDLPEKEITILVTFTGGHLDVVIYVPPFLKGKTQGLFGYYDGILDNDLTSKGGEVMSSNSTTQEIYDRFVSSWRINSQQDSLFTYPTGLAFTSKHINDPTYVPVFATQNDVRSDQLSNEVDSICRDSLECKVNLQTKVKQGTPLENTPLWLITESRSHLQEVRVCPFLEPSVDSTLNVNVSGYFPADVAVLTCPPGWSVVGYDILSCMETGQWNSNVTYCEGVLFADPPSGTMLGGQQIAILGPHLQFDVGVGIYARIAGITVTCKYASRFLAYCRTPTVFQIGVTTVYVNVMNGSPIGWIYRGEYVYQNMASFPFDVRRSLPEQWGSKGQHRITWSPESVTSEFVSIELFGYKEDLSTGQTTWKRLQTIKQRHGAAEGSYVIDATSMDIEEGFHLGIFKISPTTGIGSILWSDLHPLTWATTMDHKALCRHFTSYERTLPALGQKGLIGCPCNVARARSDDTNFKVDIGCVKEKNNAINCLYNPGAETCFRSIPIGGSEQRCCYDKKGVLLNARDLTGGASPGRYHHDGISPYRDAGTIPHLSHFSGDVMPYLHCCVYSSDFCPDYFVQRRPSDCISEFPPRPALVEGDPHFITFDEVSYNFDAVGEFVLMRAANETLEVQGRMETVKDIRGTCFTAFALKHVDTNTIEIRRGDDRTSLEIIYDRKKLTLNLTETRELAYAGITVTVESSAELSVSFTHLSVVMDIELVDGMLNAMLSIPHNFTGSTEGLLGIYNKDPLDDLTSREGFTTALGQPSNAIHVNFGVSWQVKKSESLFIYDLNYDYDFYNNRPFNPDYKFISDIDRRMVSPFVKAMCGGSKECVYDYLIKGRLNLATGNQPRRMRDKYWQRLQDLKTSQSCGFLDTIPLGIIRDVSGYAIGDSIRFTCIPGYHLVGASVTLCTDAGWDRPEGRCEPTQNLTVQTRQVRVPEPSFILQETDSTPSWAVGAVLGVVGGVATVGGTILVVRGIMVAQQVARIQAYRIMDPKFGTSGSTRPSFKLDLL